MSETSGVKCPLLGHYILTEQRSTMKTEIFTTCVKVTMIHIYSKPKGSQCGCLFMLPPYGRMLLVLRFGLGLGLGNCASIGWKHASKVWNYHDSIVLKRASIIWKCGSILWNTGCCEPTYLMYTDAMLTPMFQTWPAIHPHCYWPSLHQWPWPLWVMWPPNSKVCLNTGRWKLGRT